MDSAVNVARIGIWHKDHNLTQRDSLNELPEERSIFGIFAIIDDEPVNCRYVGGAENLAHRVKELFENPDVTGLKKFMQGPWIKMVQYELMSGSSKEERERAVGEWTLRYKPGIDEDGDYPGYY